MTLSDAIAPLPQAQFFKEYWGKDYCLMQGKPERFADLCTWSQLNQVLAEHRLSKPRLRLAKDGAQIPESDYLIFGDSKGPSLRQQALLKHLRDGATLIVDAVDEFFPNLNRFVRNLERTLNCQIQANLYAGWGTTKGFDLHWDDHDVMILQIYGRKAWKVYGTTRMHPTTQDRGNVFDPPPAPVWEGNLQPGDFLYMPRGCWHVATALAEPTLHITVGTSNKTGLDLMNWLTRRLNEVEAFRKDLPRFEDEAAKRRHCELLKEKLHEAFTGDIIDRYLGETDALARTRPMLSLPWQVNEEGFRLEDDSVVESLLTRVPVMLSEEGSVKFVALRQNMCFSSSAEGVLKQIFEAGSVRAGDLIQSNAGVADRDQIGRLVLKLSNLGLVSIR